MFRCLECEVILPDDADLAAHARDCNPAVKEAHYLVTLRASRPFRPPTADKLTAATVTGIMTHFGHAEWDAANVEVVRCEQLTAAEKDFLQELLTRDVHLGYALELARAIARKLSLV